MSVIAILEISLIPHDHELFLGSVPLGDLVLEHHTVGADQIEGGGARGGDQASPQFRTQY